MAPICNVIGAICMEADTGGLKAEDFIVLNPYEHHELYAEAGCHTISGYISPDIFRQAGLGRISCCSKSAREHTDYLDLLRTKLAILFKYSMHYTESQKPGLPVQTADRLFK